MTSAATAGAVLEGSVGKSEDEPLGEGLLLDVEGLLLDVTASSGATANAVLEGSVGNSENEALGEGLLLDVDLTASSGLCELQPVNKSPATITPITVVFTFLLYPDLLALIVH